MCGLSWLPQPRLLRGTFPFPPLVNKVVLFAKENKKRDILFTFTLKAISVVFCLANVTSRRKREVRLRGIPAFKIRMKNKQILLLHLMVIWYFFQQPQKKKGDSISELRAADRIKWNLIRLLVYCIQILQLVKKGNTLAVLKWRKKQWQIKVYWHVKLFASYNSH